ncbi:hypothetical protein BASA50_008351 [Batrachochytrium salamandrivorans]|uniref:Telomere-associated protein Rif1 N-terminal domain-containing protein n=1 Tax=Batrachochytrium salamandrivorans TaxID=1357716 RepID=A0ABQ8F4A8_9FUNG|nr:hypothetical protein BASA50_008351 [Batrachochytrium salamandrivorans]
MSEFPHAPWINIGDDSITLDRFLDLVEALDEARTNHSTEEEMLTIASKLKKMCTYHEIRRHCLVQEELDVLDCFAASIRDCIKERDYMTCKNTNRICSMILSSILELVNDSDRLIKLDDISNKKNPTLESLISKRNSVAIFRHNSGILNLIGEILCLNGNLQSDSLSHSCSIYGENANTDISCKVLLQITRNVQLSPMHPSLQALNSYYLPQSVWMAYLNLLNSGDPMDRAENIFTTYISLWSSMGSRDQIDSLLSVLFHCASRGSKPPPITTEKLMLPYDEFLESLLRTADTSLGRGKSLGTTSNDLCTKYALGTLSGSAQNLIQFMIHFVFTRIKGTYKSQLLKYIRKELFDCYISLRTKDVRIAISDSTCSKSSANGGTHSQIYYVTPYNLKQSFVEINAMLVYSALESADVSLNLAQNLETSFLMLFGNSPSSDLTCVGKDSLFSVCVTTDMNSDHSSKQFLVFAEFVYEYYSKMITLNGYLSVNVLDPVLWRGIQSMCVISARILLLADASEASSMTEPRTHSCKNSQSHIHSALTRSILEYLAHRHASQWIDTCFTRPMAWRFLVDFLNVMLDQQPGCNEDLANESNSGLSKHLSCHSKISRPLSNLHSNAKSTLDLHETLATSKPIASTFLSLNPLPHIGPLVTHTAVSTLATETPENQRYKQSSETKQLHVPTPQSHYETVLQNMTLSIRSTLSSLAPVVRPSMRPKSASIATCRKQKIEANNGVVERTSDVYVEKTRRIAYSSEANLTRRTFLLDKELLVFLNSDAADILPRLQSTLIRIPSRLACTHDALQSLVFALTAARASFQTLSCPISTPDLRLPLTCVSRSNHSLLQPLSNSLRPTREIGNTAQLQPIHTGSLANMMKLVPVPPIDPPPVLSGRCKKPISYTPFCGTIN